MCELQLREHMEAQIRQIESLYQSERYGEAYYLSTTVTEAIGFYKRYWDLDFTLLFSRILAVRPEYQLMMVFTAELLYQQGQYVSASDLAAVAVRLENSGGFFNINYIRMLRAAGRLGQARSECLRLLELAPNEQNLEAELAQCDAYGHFSEKDYYSVLHAVHRKYKPATYLEIGLAQGRSLALVGKQTKAIGIDPDTAEQGRMMYMAPENSPLLFRTTSDDFFNRADLPALLETDTLDMAFLDGLHLFEQTLRDFINVERFSGPETMIFIHDGLPLNWLVAERNRKTAFWVGDVWKIIPCLKEVRPDLEIITFPVLPSGLTLIRGLDPKSRVLERQLDVITKHFRELELPESWEERKRLLNITNQSPEQVLGLSELR